MISLQPREQFQIVRQLGDHTDATVYYVRAVVRDSVTDTILKTQNLTVNATDIRRFKANYEVPADISGLGFYIDITTSVYTDSGYTTKASTYSDELESYLVFDRIMKTGGGSGGGSEIDYKKIKKMIDEVIKNFPETKEFDLKPILSALNETRKAIDSIEMPEIEKINLQPVLSAISSAESTIVKAIDTKEVTPEVDLSSVFDAIEKKEPNLDEVKEKIDKLESLINVIIEDEKQRDSLKSQLTNIATAIAPFIAKDTEPKKVDTRITKLLP